MKNCLSNKSKVSTKVKWIKLPQMPKIKLHFHGMRAQFTFWPFLSLKLRVRFYNIFTGFDFCQEE